MTSFKKRYPDFASVERHIRRAQAERSLAIATAIADGIVAVIRGIGRLTADKPVQRTRAAAAVAKASVPRQAARI